MKKIYLTFLLFCFLSVGYAQKDIESLDDPHAGVRVDSKYPIVLIHGFLGWGPNELLGYRYWGGTGLNIEKYLRKKGFEVYTVSVSPVSSNHDRACQAFAQIFGGQVDYGAAHVAKHPHDRFGKTYSGLYTQWREDKPIHIIGHSMGGQTARYLSELLEQDYFGKGTSSRWIKSITSVATPHNGTTFTHMVDGLSGGHAEEIVMAILALAGTDWKVYDFDLDFWHLKPKEGEDLGDFLKRIDETAAKNKEDFAMHDLMPHGAKELNEEVRHFDHIYYFSYAVEETYSLFTGREYPELEMNPFFWIMAQYMGSYEGDAVTNHKDWWKNDGVVNTVSMIAPHNAEWVEFDGTPKKGVWNYMGLTSSKDHLKVVGHYQGPLSGYWLRDYYFKMAENLTNLPEAKETSQK